MELISLISVYELRLYLNIYTVRNWDHIGDNIIIIIIPLSENVHCNLRNIISLIIFSYKLHSAFIPL